MRSNRMGIGLVVVDPYNDFISEGGKIWPRIREVAEANNVPVVENQPLARALYATVEIEDEVPPEHYKAVAEVIGYVMRLKGAMG